MTEWTQERRERLEALFAKPFTSRDRDKVRVSDIFAALSEIDRTRLYDDAIKRLADYAAEIDRLTARVEAQRDVMRLALAFIEPICDEMWTDIGAERQEGGKPSQEQMARAQGVGMLVESLTKHTAVPALTPPGEEPA